MEMVLRAKLACWYTQIHLQIIFSSNERSFARRCMNEMAQNYAWVRLLMNSVTYIHIESILANNFCLLSDQRRKLDRTLYES